MPFQNRVTPAGAIVALPGRGMFMGNRGVLHDEQKCIVRPWQVKRWICCVTEFRGRRREIMAPHRWTELFFLDEAAALAAGHRPCAECRNADYKRFRGVWEAEFGKVRSVDEIDAVLHAERLNGRAKRTYTADIGLLPDGTYVSHDGRSYLLCGGKMAAWTDAGYEKPLARPANGFVEVLTPKSIVTVLKSGYTPCVHPTFLRRDRTPA